MGTIYIDNNRCDVNPNLGKKGRERFEKMRGKDDPQWDYFCNAGNNYGRNKGTPNSQVYGANNGYRHPYYNC